MNVLSRPSYPTFACYTPSMDPLPFSTSVSSFMSATIRRFPPSCSFQSSSVTDGLQTPPPEMIPSVTYSRPRYASQNVPPTQINQPIHDSGVSKILNFSQSVSQNIEQRRSNPNPLQQQQSTTNYSQPQFDESNKKKIVPAASLRVPDTISPVGGNLADFAAQVGPCCLQFITSVFDG